MPKKTTSAASQSEQSGAATRGTEAGSAAEVTAAGAGAGVAQSGAGAQYGVAGAEGISDVGQAERYIDVLSRQASLSQDFRTFMNGSLARLTTLAELNVAQSLDVAGRQKHNGVSHDKIMDSVNQSERENSLQIGDKTNTIDMATLAKLVQSGIVLSCPKSK